MNPNGVLWQRVDNLTNKAEKALPSKDELQNTVVGILKKVDFNTVSYCAQGKKLSSSPSAMS